MKNLVVNSVEVKLEVVENEIFTTSLQVAEVFEKEHKNVLRDLEKFKFNELNFELVTPAEIDDFFKKNFILSEYVDAKGERRPMYRMTKDGFALLVMGFTGEKAMLWKIEYIKAFNLMRNELMRIYEEKYQIELANEHEKLFEQKIETARYKEIAEELEQKASDDAFKQAKLDCIRFKNESRKLSEEYEKARIERLIYVKENKKAEMEMRELKRRVKELEDENDFLEKSVKKYKEALDERK